MKKFVIALMATLTIVVGLGAMFTVIYSIKQEGVMWGVIYFVSFVCTMLFIIHPLQSFWVKYWEEKLK